MWEAILAAGIGSVVTALMVGLSTWFVQRNVGKTLIEHEDSLRRRDRARATVLVPLRDGLRHATRTSLINARATGPVRSALESADAPFIPDEVSQAIQGWLEAERRVQAAFGRIVQEISSLPFSSDDQGIVFRTLLGETPGTTGDLGGEDALTAAQRGEKLGARSTSVGCLSQVASEPLTYHR